MFSKLFSKKPPEQKKQQENQLTTQQPQKQSDAVQLRQAIDNFDIKKIQQMINENKIQPLFNGLFLDTKTTILSYAIQSGHSEEQILEMVKLFIGAGANPAARDFHQGDEGFGNTALLNAINEEKWKIAEFLINAYDPKKQGDDYINMPSLLPQGKSSPLLLALKKTNAPIEIIELLLKAGADPNFKDHNGDTPLYFAAYIGNDSLIDILLRFKANIQIGNALGFIPYDIYMMRHFEDTENRSYTVASEINGYPTFEFNPEGVSSDTGITPAHQLLGFVGEFLQLKISNTTLLTIKQTRHPDYQQLSFSPETINPHNHQTVHRAQPNEKMKARLYPEGHQGNPLLRQYEQKVAEQMDKINKGYFLLNHHDPSINNLLAVFNNNLDKTNSSKKLQELRMRIGTSRTMKLAISAITKFYADNSSKLDNNEKEILTLLNAQLPQPLNITFDEQNESKFKPT